MVGLADAGWDVLLRQGLARVRASAALASSAPSEECGEPAKVEREDLGLLTELLMKPAQKGEGLVSLLAKAPL